MLTVLRRVLELFERRERWDLLALCGVLVIGALVQTIGVASIMPFMSMVADPALVMRNAWTRTAFDALGFSSPRPFLIVVGLVVLAIMAASNAVAAFEHWFMLRVICMKQHRLAVRLLGQYLGAPYAFFLERNTSGLAKNILNEVREVVDGVLTPLLRIFAQLLVVMCIFGLLIAIDVAVALTAGTVLAGSYAVLYMLVRRKQGRLGKVRRTANAQRFKAASEALGSIKETRVAGREGEFVQRFASANLTYATANASNAIVRDLPRFLLETVAFGGILLIVLYLLHTRDDFGEAVAVMSLYALAGYRLMPALQQVFRGIAQVRFFGPALENLHEDLSRTADSVRSATMQAQEAADALTFEREVVLHDVSFSYPGRSGPVVSRINLTLEKNRSVAFVGGTGSGKTTVVDILLGLLEPQQGEMRVDGRVVTPAAMPAWRRKVGYVPQQIFLCDDTIARNVAFGVPEHAIDHDAVERAIRTAHLDEFVATLPDGAGAVVGEHGVRLSGGQRQRIGIARALYHDPQVLVMDEATSALDGITEEAVIRAIRELAASKTIVLVAHRLSTVRACDVVYVFDRGKILAAGTYAELMQSCLHFRNMARVADVVGVA